MKLLTIAIPCYNSSNYMRHCIDSCLIGGNSVEIIIINDGSSDTTGIIADEYQIRFPKIVKVIHQENKGHGGAVNAGINASTGKYFKVLDSDDWLNEESLVTILNFLRKLDKSNDAIDMLLSDFIYEQEGRILKKKMSYKSVIPRNQKVTWNSVKSFNRGQYVLMHAIIFRTEILKNSKLKLPEKTFYVDNIYVFVPLQLVKSIYYLDIVLYHYYIGRDDQSINEEIMMKRIDQQIKVNKLLIDSYDETSQFDVGLELYLKRHIKIVTLISSALLNQINTSESYEKKIDLWNYIEERIPETYKNINYSLTSKFVKLKGQKARRVSNIVYKTVRKVAGYN